MPTISIGFQIQNKGNGFQELIVDADKFKNLLAQTVVESKKLEDKMVSFGSVSIGLDALSSAFQQLQGFTKDFTSAYDTQMEAERQLEQVMMNTMGARTEDIQSIKDFCSAQQEIGIVGDEVQLAGAQEMATYLEFKGSLKTLIPVMNDMVAQQYGYNHTAENAVGIATMLGKVMQGQTSALSRLGYTFDESQEKILKYGTESERAAVLAEVVGESVGGMNRKLAETDTGRMKQLENNLGDLKEQLGGILKKADPFIAIASNATVALIGVNKLITGVRALAISMKALSVAGGVVTLALTAIAGAYLYFTSKSDEATESIKRLTDAKKQEEEATQRSKDIIEAEDEARKAALSSLELNKARLKDFNGTKKEEKKLVGEMNDTYGRTMGYFKSVSEWYNALIKNSKAYCDQMVKEAKARKYADQIADLEMQLTDIAYNKDGSTKKYSKQRRKDWRTLTPEEQKRNSPERKKLEERGVKITGRHIAGKFIEQAYEEIEGSSEFEKIEKAIHQKGKELAFLRKQQNEAVKSINMPVMGSEDRPDLSDKNSSKTVKTRSQEIDAKIKKQEEKYLTASETEKGAIRSTVNELKEEKRQIELSHAELSRPLDLKSIQDFNDEIAYQQKLLASASKEDVASIQKTIDALELQRDALSVPLNPKTIEEYSKAISFQQKLRSSASSSEEIARYDEEIKRLTHDREQLERKAHIEVDADKISSYREVEEEISFYTDLLQDCTEEERRLAEANLPALLKKEKELGLRNAGIGVARNPEEVANIADAEAAISYLDQLIQNSSADEAEAYQRTKMAFEEKKKALERGIEIPKMQKEVEELMKLPQQQLTVKIKAMGFDELSEKLREIDRQLNDLDNPPTDGQRKALEQLRDVYAGWQRQCVMSFDTFKDGWSSIGTISSGIDSLSSALDNNASVWDRVTSAINGFINIHEGISAIIGIINTLNAVTGATATATTAATVAKGTEAAAAEASALAQAPAIAANKLATASYVELAAAEYMAAHAYIPFAGFGIGSGFAAAAKGVVTGIGAVPFAEGGIVSGPTLGLVGEYAGAKNNPEVIAPLNKLRDLIGNDGDGANGRVEFEIRGDRLYGLLRKYERNKNRT